MCLKKIKIFTTIIYKNEHSPFCSFLAAKILYKKYISYLNAKIICMRNKAFIYNLLIANSKIPIDESNRQEIRVTSYVPSL